MYLFEIHVYKKIKNLQKSNIYLLELYKILEYYLKVEKKKN